MDSSLNEVEAKMRRTSEEVTRMMASLAADLAGASHVLSNDIAGMQIEIKRLNNLLEKTKIALETSERNKERFRYALWVYLQERDGLAGQNAPTTETLTLIRELIQELQ